MDQTTRLSGLGNLIIDILLVKISFLHFEATNLVQGDILCLYQDSESSEDEEGITVEELKKTEGWKLLMDALDSKIEKKQDTVAVNH